MNDNNKKTKELELDELEEVTGGRLIGPYNKLLKFVDMMTGNNVDEKTVKNLLNQEYITDNPVGGLDDNNFFD